MTEPEYNEKTCITAGELRAAGVTVPESVPDYGWVPRASVTFGAPKASHGDEPGSIRVDVPVKITEPFRWVHLDVTLEPEKT